MNRTVNRPASLQSGRNSLGVLAGFLRPFTDRLGPAVVRKTTVVALVHVLRALRGPAHVPRLVVAVVVNTINRVFRGWARTNIGQEILERFSPSCTDGNPSASVMFVAFHAWVVAPSLHAVPRQMFRRDLPIGGMAVSQMQRLRDFKAKTSARQGLPAADIVRGDITFNTTGASVSKIPAVLGWPNERPTSMHHALNCIAIGGCAA